MAKTIQQGYYKLKPANKWLHFSMNAWINLKRDSEQDLGTIGEAFKNDADVIEQYATICEIVYAAAKAYDQEEGNDIDYNVFNVRQWVEKLSFDETSDLVKAMMSSINKPVMGKKKAKK